MRPGGLSLGTKLNLALLAFLLVLGFATLAVVIYGFERTQKDAEDRSQLALEEQGKLALEALAGGVSESGALQFESAAAVAQHASRYMQDFKASGGSPVYDTSRFASTDTGVLYDPSPDRVSDVVVINHGRLEGAVLEDIAYTAALDPLFPALAQAFPGQLSDEAYNPIAIIYVGISGVGRYYPPIGIHESTPPEVDVSDFYDRFGPVANPQRETVWTTPYEDLQGRGLVITAQTPVYDGDTFKGIFEVDLSIGKLVELVNTIKATPGGFTFYVDTDGGILETDSFDFLNSEAQTSQDLARILEAMAAPGDQPSAVTVEKVSMGGEDYFIAYTPMAMPGGSIGVAAPIAELTADAATITSGIKDEGNRTFLIIVVALGTLFITGLIAATYLNRRVLIGPIRELAAATRSVAAGELDTKVEIERSDELGTLGQSFNAMVEQLRESERQLEQRVEDRTRELSALLESSRALSSTLTFQRLVELILDELKSVIDYTGASVIRLTSSAGEVVDSRGPLGREDGMIGHTITFDWTAEWIQPVAAGAPLVLGNVRESGGASSGIARSIIAELDSPAFAYVVSFIIVPLTSEGELVGILTMSKDEPDFFTEEHVRLATAFASHAAAATANATLFEDTQRSARETAALLESSRALVSSLDVRDVIQTVLSEISTIIEHTGASVLLIRDGALEFFGARSTAAETARTGMRIPVEYGDFLWGPFVRGDAVIIDDVRADTEIAARYRAAINSIGQLDNPPFNIIRSWMAVPLLHKGATIGMITFSWTEPGYFTAEHGRLARAFADQVALAIENARLYDESQQRAREFEALSRADTELFRSLDLDTVLQALVDVTVDVLGHEKSMVVTWDPGTGRLSLRAWRNLSERGLEMIRDMYLRVATDMENAAIIATEDPADAHPEEAPIVAAEGIRSYIQVPVISSAGQPLGFFSVASSTDHHFSDDERRLLLALADRAAVAVENAELYQKSQQVASLEERQRLARELHDSVSQALYGIALGARTARTQLDRDPRKVAEPLDYVLSLAEAGLAEMRALIFELRPESLETEGLVAAISKQASAVKARYGIDVEFGEPAEPDATLDVKEAAYRVTQEALHNVVKHAKAKRVTIAVGSNNGSLAISITDDGTGFDPSADYAGHLGLKSMRERAERAGGKLTIDSAPGRGSTVSLELPVRR